MLTLCDGAALHKLLTRPAYVGWYLEYIFNIAWRSGCDPFFSYLFFNDVRNATGGHTVLFFFFDV